MACLRWRRLPRRRLLRRPQRPLPIQAPCPWCHRRHQPPGRRGRPDGWHRRPRRRRGFCRRRAPCPPARLLPRAIPMPRGRFPCRCLPVGRVLRPRRRACARWCCCRRAAMRLCLPPLPVPTPTAARNRFLRILRARSIATACKPSRLRTKDGRASPAGRCMRSRLSRRSIRSIPLRCPMRAAGSGPIALPMRPTPFSLRRCVPPMPLPIWRQR